MGNNPLSSSIHRIGEQEAGAGGEWLFSSRAHLKAERKIKYIKEKIVF